MSVIHSDKCDKIALSELKGKVISLLADNGINVSNLEIKTFTCYGGDVRVYLGTNERISKKTTFRKEEADIVDGKIVGYYGTRGKRAIKERDYVAFNAEDFEEEDNMIKYNIQVIKNYLQCH